VLVAELLNSALTATDLRQALQAARRLATRPEDVPPLLPQLAEALRDAHPRLARRAALIHGVLGPAALGNLRALLQALTGPRWTVREVAVEAVALVAIENESVLDALLERALFDRTSAVRAAAVTALYERAADVLGRIQAALGHVHPRVRCRALRAFARLAPSAARIEPLLRALDDSHFRVRRDAAGLLGTQGRAALPAVPRLSRCCFDGEPRVARAARRSLERIASEAPAALGGWLTRLTSSSDPRQGLLDALGASDLPESLLRPFIAVCRRRRVWFTRNKGSTAQAVEETPAAEAAATLAAAGKRADRESAWLIGWLAGELVRQGGDEPEITP
jgi:hypothetical protein